MTTSGRCDSEPHDDMSGGKITSISNLITTTIGLPGGKNPPRTDSATDAGQVASKSPTQSSVYTPNPEPPWGTAIGVPRAPNATPRQFHSQEYSTTAGLEQHQDSKTELYERQWLKEVRETVKHDHEFVATKRMYTARFKKCGVRNVTADYITDLPSEEQGQGPRQGHNQKSLIGRPRDPATTFGQSDAKRTRRYITRGSASLNKLAIKERNRVVKGFGPLEVNRRLSNARRSGDQPESRLHKETINVRRPPSTRHLPQVPLPDPQYVGNFLESLFSSHHFSSTHRSPFPSVQDVYMLDFVIKFRLAHILHEERNQQGGSPLLQACLDALFHALQATGSDNAGIITCLIYIILAALETATSYGSSSMLLWLFDRLAVICAQHYPLIANVAIQMSHYDSHDSLLDLLLQAKQVIPTGPGSSVATSIALQLYVETVYAAVNTDSPKEVHSTLQALMNKLLAGTSPLASEALIVWAELRSAFALYEAYASSEQPTSSVGDPTKLRLEAISRILGKLRVQRDFYESKGGWAIAGRLGREMREISRVVEGGCSEAAARVPGSEEPRQSLACMGGAPRRSST